MTSFLLLMLLPLPGLADAPEPQQADSSRALRPVAPMPMSVIDCARAYRQAREAAAVDPGILRFRCGSVDPRMIRRAPPNPDPGMIVPRPERPWPGERRLPARRPR